MQNQRNYPRYRPQKQKQKPRVFPEEKKPEAAPTKPVNPWRSVEDFEEPRAADDPGPVTYLVPLPFQRRESKTRRFLQMYHSLPEAIRAKVLVVSSVWDFNPIESVVLHVGSSQTTLWDSKNP